MPGFCICFIRCKNERTLFLCNLNFQIIKLQRFNKIILCEPRFRSPFKLRNIRIEPDRLRQIPGIAEFLAEFTSERAWGEDGYLSEKGLIPMPKEERKTVAAAVKALKVLGGK